MHLGQKRRLTWTLWLAVLWVWYGLEVWIVAEEECRVDFDKTTLNRLV